MGRGAMHLFARFLSAAAFAASLFVCAFLSDSALADKRVALVVGNSNYQNVPQLPNPASDAKAVADLLTKAGFTVDLEIDLGNLAFKRAIRSFEDAANGADMAVVFFAGHGFEIRGTNYLIPVDAKLADERDAPDEAIALDRLLEAVSPARRLALIMVDACRDNPFLVTMKRLTVSRSLSRGLARVEPEGTDTLIAFAAKDGSTAEDGHGLHSPFTTALLDNLTTPGLDVQLVFRRVRDEVLKITDGRQEPFVYGSLGGKTVALVPGPDQVNQTPGADVRRDFELAAQIGTVEAWQAFLNTYKTGFYAELAKAALAKVNGDQHVAILERPAAPTKVPTLTDDALAWDRLRDSTDPAALQDFIARFPNSPLALEAQRKLQILQEIAKEREVEKAQAEWDSIKNSGDQAVIKDFIVRHPNSPLAATAQERIADLQKVAKEQEDKARTEWSKLKNSNDMAALQSFMARYPKSALTSNARERIANLQQAAKALEEKAAAEWAKLRESNDQAALQSFIARYPDSPLTLNAQERLAAVQQIAKAQEEQAQSEWSKVKDSSDLASLQSFIARYPASPLVAGAQNRLRQLQQLAQAQDKKARAEWGKVQNSHNASVVQSFIARFPNSSLAASAKEHLAALQKNDAVQAQKARTEWDAAKTSGDPHVVQSFIDRYPNAQVTAEAQKRLSELQTIAKAQEQKAAGEWNSLKNSDDQAALESFAARYPNSTLAADARARLAKVRTIAQAEEQKARTEWARIQNSNEPEDFRLFMSRYPRSALVAGAQQRLAALQQIAEANAAARKPPVTSSGDDAIATASVGTQPIVAPGASASSSTGNGSGQQKSAAAQAAAPQSTAGKHDKLSMLETPAASSSFESGLTDDQRAWERIKDSADQAALQAFIAKFPNSPLSLKAQQQLEILKQAEREQQQTRPAASEADHGGANAPVAQSNTPELIHAAQVELRRLGCFSGDADGKLTGATEDGISRYLSKRGGENAIVAVTQDLVAKLRNEHSRVCALECGAGETAQGDTCVANRPAKEKEKQTAHREEEHHKAKEAHRKAADEERPRRQAERSAPRPRAREEVSAGHPSGGGGGGGAAIGVGF